MVAEGDILQHDIRLAQMNRYRAVLLFFGVEDLLHRANGRADLRQIIYKAHSRDQRTDDTEG